MTRDEILDGVALTLAMLIGDLVMFGRIDLVQSLTVLPPVVDKASAQVALEAMKDAVLVAMAGIQSEMQDGVVN